MLDAIAEAVAIKHRREDKTAARIQWAALVAGGVKAGSGSPLEPSDLETTPPTEAERAAREKRRADEARAAELQFIAQTKAWIASRAKPSQ